MLFGCPPPPGPNLWKLEKKVFTVQKYIAPNFQYSLLFFFFFFFFFENFDPLEIFFKLLLSTC